MTVVRDRDGQGHALLMVRTDRGDLILDNEDGLIRKWGDTPYLYLKRQSQSDPAQWVGLVDSHQTTIVAARGATAEPVGSATP
jgi:predicted transglutaminase-like cysteine proteinase